MQLYKNDLVIAYIKELLKDFNLPMVPVLTENTIPYRGRLYVNDRKIGYIGEQNYLNTRSASSPIKMKGYFNGLKFEPLYDFVRNYPIVNLTKNFIIRSSVYDEYTHNYLGEYLRFLRDYDNVNLMGMYNCFYKQQPRKLKRKEAINSDITFDINTDDTNFNYYLVPVKFNQKYTISISSPVAFEVALVIHNNINLSESGNKLIKYSYKKISGTSSKAPFIYDTTVNDGGLDIAEDLWPKEKFLRLLIKMPASVDSAITILEGDWVDSASYIGTQSTFDVTMGNKEIYYDENDNPIDLDINWANQYLSKASLLRTNDKTQIPFSNRLVEYLLFNAITSNEFIDGNIKRLQDQLFEYIPGEYGIWTNELRLQLYSRIFEEDLMLGNNSKAGANVYSVDTGSKPSNFRRLVDTRFDLTGFVDKDLERQLDITRDKEI